MCSWTISFQRKSKSAIVNSPTFPITTSPESLKSAKKNTEQQGSSGIFISTPYVYILWGTAILCVPGPATISFQRKSKKHFQLSQCPMGFSCDTMIGNKGRELPTCIISAAPLASSTLRYPILMPFRTPCLTNLGASSISLFAVQLVRIVSKQGMTGSLSCVIDATFELGPSAI
ncbi:hypothetical protein FEM48_Zijuj12G0107000 [Ziziphus jujuba var. spinosa]|uniref:Uncharacterized protein n=1 Tax=Ziziphus jujuba var. spinosa TaxID=714518 RepID=A0A978UCU8_ZIZJJ|nr:hypothetical protein FEM48_Zijuj12G0107000 [Ziziphus jujuba var. spinosa]